MKQAVVLAFATTSVLLALACGGGGSGESVRYAETVVPIKHLDLDGVELTDQDLLHPSFANRYPSVVAEVNGQPITGEALAREQVSLELQRRGAIEAPLSLALGFGSIREALQERTNTQVQAIDSTDPLEVAIDHALQLQAAKRLDLIPTGDEAIDLVRRAQQSAETALANVSPAQRAAFEESLRAQGLLDTDWTALAGVVEAVATQGGLRALRRAKCDKGPTPGLLSYASGYDCDAFLAQERKNADIVYYVRWAD